MPISVHLKLLPEVLVQSLLLSWVLFNWITRPKKWLSWVMGAAFLVVLLVPLLALMARATAL